MSQTEREAREAVDDVIEEFGPLEFDPEDAQRVKDAENAARQRRKVERAQRSR